MKDNKLISMVDFVLDIDTYEETVYDDCMLIKEYANFLSAPLNIGMFVPAIKVGGEWEVLEEPKDYKRFKDSVIQEYTVLNDNGMLCEQYQTAKDNVIFEGFDSCELIGSILIIEFEAFELRFDTSCKIEMLINEPITLTKYGLEVIGLNR